MRMSDWSSDVCSSNLAGDGRLGRHHQGRDAVRQVDVEAAAEADAAEELAGADRLVELHLAYDAARNKAGALHETDIDPVVGGPLHRHALAVLRGLVSCGIDKLAGTVTQLRAGALARHPADVPVEEVAEAVEAGER